MSSSPFPDNLTKLICLSLQPFFAYELYSHISKSDLLNKATQVLQAQFLWAGNLRTLIPFSNEVPRKTKRIPPYLQTDYFPQRENCYRAGCG